MAEGHSGDVVIVGGGIIGLTVAWRLGRLGVDVTVIERDSFGGATSRVAAGMLAPAAEVEFGAAGRRLLDLGLRSAEMWPGFAGELEQASGIEVGLRRTGTLLLARDEDEVGELERALAFRRSLGLKVERLRPSQAREREPALAPTLRLALELADDHAVDPRRVTDALRLACEAVGVRLREHAPVASLLLDGGRVLGVRLGDGERVTADAVVLATGPWAEQIEGLSEVSRVPVRPVKGQILRLRDPAGPGLLDRVVRYEGGYLVPRGDGRYVLGATVEERGFELAPTAGGVYELLREARELVPGITELQIEELSVGLRPSTPDNLPVIGRGAVEGLVWATGHHRNGILLAPLTGALIAGVLSGAGGEDSSAELLDACDPARFTSVPAAGVSA
jgi:glycine oxidase